MKRWLGVLSLFAALVSFGCQSDGDLPADEEKVLRGKISEGLSPAEIEKHFGKDGLKRSGPGGAPSAPSKSAGGG
jgi:hypothetical protein